MTRELGERQPTQDFDMVLIAGKLKGWELAMVSDSDNEGGGIKSWIFSRLTPDDEHLILAINPLSRRVRFAERIKGSLTFSITCEGIEHVQIGNSEISEDLTFLGDIHYRIDLGGMGHEVRLGYNQEPIVTRTYDFDPPKK